MSSILEQLYAGDLTPAENVIQGNEEYDRLCRQSVQEIEEFSKKLDDESRKSFDALLEHYLELTYIEKARPSVTDFVWEPELCARFLKEGNVCADRNFLFVISNKCLKNRL